jgi:hypothetical protein
VLTRAFQIISLRLRDGLSTSHWLCADIVIVVIRSYVAAITKIMKASYVTRGHESVLRDLGSTEPFHKVVWH